MVQVLPAVDRGPSKGQILAGAITGGVNTAGQLYQAYQQQQRLAEENEALKRGGIDTSGIYDPNIRKAYITESLKGINQRNRTEKDVANELRDYQTIKDNFGENIANLWRASTVGGKTKLEDRLLDAWVRGENLESSLNQNTQPMQQLQFDQEEKIPQLKEGKVSKDYKWPAFNQRPQGYTPKEWSQERTKWRTENAPIYNKVNTDIDTNKRNLLGTKRLNKLNNTRKIGEGFQGLLINPETNEFYGLAQLAGLITPEAQEWVKEIARFQNRAKDAFGSRVTNFDLQSYMKQFPGLLNTYEGRKRILRMMEINYELDDLHDKALSSIYNHYGLSNIPQEKADDMARQMIQEETQRLENEFLHYDIENLESSEHQLSPEIIKKYFDMANGDVEEAERLAREDGYTW